MAEPFFTFQPVFWSLYLRLQGNVRTPEKKCFALTCDGLVACPVGVEILDSVSLESYELQGLQRFTAVTVLFTL